MVPPSVQGFLTMERNSQLDRGTIPSRFLTLLSGLLSRAFAALPILTFSEDDHEIITAHYSGAVTRWDARTGQILGVLTTHHGSAKALCNGPDGSFLTGGRDGTIHCSHPSRETVYWPIANTIINSVKSSPDQTKFAIASRDHSIRIHDVKTGKERMKHTANAWSNDGSEVVAGYYNGSIVIWDLTLDQSKIISPTDGNAISQVSFMRDGSLAIGSWNPSGWAVILSPEPNPPRRIGGHY